jgi:hypothetical protein
LTTSTHKKISAGGSIATKYNDIKGREVYRSANVSGSLTKNSIIRSGGLVGTGTIKLTKKVSNRINNSRHHVGGGESRENTERRNEKRISSRPISEDDSHHIQSPAAESNVIFNSGSNQGTLLHKK